MQPKLLLPIVIVIWVLVGYKIVNGVNTGNDVAVATPFEASFVPKVQEAQESFTISLAERDPFLGTLTTAKPKKRPSKQPIQSNVPAKDDPKVVFGGLIKRQGSSKQVFVISVNGKQYLYKKGQTIDGVKLISGNAKRITVGYNRKTQKITLD